MQQADIVKNAFAMPLANPAYPKGPYRFIGREYLVISYRTDPDKLRALAPEPLQVDPAKPYVTYEFMRMPDSTGFGDYTESGQVIPVTFNGKKGGYSHCMFLDDEGPIAGGRELWGFPKKLASPSLKIEIDTLVGILDYGSVRVATATMGYKHKAMDLASLTASLHAPGYLLKIIPHVDGTPRVCELVEYYLEDLDLKWAYIQYSSRTRAATDQFKRTQRMRCALAGLLKDLPPELHGHTSLDPLKSAADHKVYNIVHLIYRSKQYEINSKDYDFSRLAMNEHWRSGLMDARLTLAHPEIFGRTTNHEGVLTFDFLEKPLEKTMKQA